MQRYRPFYQTFELPRQLARIARELTLVRHASKVSIHTNGRRELVRTPERIKLVAVFFRASYRVYKSSAMNHFRERVHVHISERNTVTERADRSRINYTERSLSWIYRLLSRLSGNIPAWPDEVWVCNSPIAMNEETLG